MVLLTIILSIHFWSLLHTSSTLFLYPSMISKTVDKRKQDQNMQMNHFVCNVEQNGKYKRKRALMQANNLLPACFT
uniref:Putative secreted peptide n=1 Tax=Anopheles braziliensis TaxID=58242 RepID=A0A2M3ZQV9_9DIPT